MLYRSIYREGLLEDQVIVVSGGGSGIGRCIAHEVAALGAQAVLIGRREENLEKVAKEIAEDGGKVGFFACDIREETRVKETVAEIVAKYGRIDGLVNNAGGQFPAPLDKISANGWQAVLNTNLMGGFLFARECYTQSMKGRGGAIVNIIADMWGGMPGMGHRGAALDGGPHRVAVVLHDKDAGEGEEPREVHRLVQRALVERPVAEEGERDFLLCGRAVAHARV